MLTHFDLDVTYLRVDKELADLSIKELFSDLIWRFCRISNDQFRKDMLRTLKKQKSESLRKRVIEIPKDARMTQLSMSYIIKDNSVDKKSSHFKLQSLIFDAGESILKSFTKKEILLLSKTYNLNLFMKNDKNQLCDSLAKEIPKFQSMPDTSVFSDSAQPEQQEHAIVESKQPTMKTSVKRKAKSKFTMKKTRKTKVAVEEEKDDTKCANCDRLYYENENWIQCDLCDKWYDRFCQNMDETSFEALGDSDWYCEKCCA